MDTFKPSFYKILIDFTNFLGVPEEFMEKYGALLPKKTKLRIASGTTWEVALEKLEDKKYYFTRGWANFSRQMGLEEYELLVFAFVGNGTFYVTVYGVSAFEKASNYALMVNDDDSDDVSDVGIVG